LLSVATTAHQSLLMHTWRRAWDVAQTRMRANIMI
jgi:hypothetical protein